MKSQAPPAEEDVHRAVVDAKRSGGQGNGEHDHGHRQLGGLDVLCVDDGNHGQRDHVVDDHHGQHEGLEPVRE